VGLIASADEKNADAWDLRRLLRLNHRTYNHHRDDQKKMNKIFHRVFHQSAEC